MPPLQILIFSSHCKGDRVDVSNLDSILSSLGIHLTSEEMQEALKHIAVDGEHFQSPAF